MHEMYWFILIIPIDVETSLEVQLSFVSSFVEASWSGMFVKRNMLLMVTNLLSELDTLTSADAKFKHVLQKLCGLLERWFARCTETGAF